MAVRPTTALRNSRSDCAHEYLCYQIIQIAFENEHIYVCVFECEELYCEASPAPSLHIQHRAFPGEIHQKRSLGTTPLFSALCFHHYYSPEAQGRVRSLFLGAYLGAHGQLAKERREAGIYSAGDSLEEHRA